MRGVKTPQSPYYAVIIASQRNEGDRCYGWLRSPNPRGKPLKGLHPPDRC